MLFAIMEAVKDGLHVHLGVSQGETLGGTCARTAVLDAEGVQQSFSFFFCNGYLGAVVYEK